MNELETEAFFIEATKPKQKTLEDLADVLEALFPLGDATVLYVNNGPFSIQYHVGKRTFQFGYDEVTNALEVLNS